jgi:hypothetical protein
MKDDVESVCQPFETGAEQMLGVRILSAHLNEGSVMD